MALIGNGIRLNANPGLYTGGLNRATSPIHFLKHHSNVRPFWFGEGTVAVTPPVVSAWSFGSSIMATTNKSSSVSWSPVTTGALTAGEVGILQISFDNIGTAIGDNSEVTSVTDAAGNTWLKAREYTRTAGVAADGVTVSVWYSKITSTLSSGGAVTINFSGTTTAKVAHLNRFTVSNGGGVTVVGSAVETQAGADPGSMNITTSSGGGEHLFYRAIAMEAVTGVFPTNTAGYTALADTSTIGGLATSNVFGAGEWRIFTGGSDTSDPTYSAVDSASVFIAFDVGGAGSIASIANKNGWPMGSTHPHCWVMPIKAGAMASRNNIAGTGTITADLLQGKDLVADLAGVGVITSADIALSTGLSADLTGVGTISSADMVGTVECTADLTGTGTISSAPLSMLAGLEAALSGTGTITADATGIAELSADIVVSAAVADATAIATAVWQYIIENGYSAIDIQRLLAARQLGESTGGPDTPAYLGLDGLTVRVTGNVTSSGDRSGVVLTP